STGIRMLLIVLAGGCCGILSGVFTNLCAQNYGNDLRKDCFRRIMGFSYEQTDRFSTGSLVTRMTNDVTQVQNMVAQIIRGMVRCMMFFVGGSFALLRMDLSFGVIVACTIPLVLLDVGFVLWKTNPLFSLLQTLLDRVNAVVQENVAGARVVKAFVQEDTETERFESANGQLVDTQLRVLVLLSWLRPVMNIVLNLAVVAILYVGAGRVQAGAVAPGSVMAAITYISQILNGMMMLAMIFQTLTRGRASARRLREVLDTVPSIRDGGAPDGFSQAPGGSIRLRHVSFSYPGTDTEVLHDVDLDVAPGTTLGIIGATASGKTTLVNLIPRFYDVTDGAVEVDGVDVRSLGLRDLRSRVSVVLQKSELFSTTIRDNIALGRRDATDEELRAAAKAAQADEFISRQPEGYDTPVAERGMSLSGGQRQRVAISRALLRRGEILIFDDATSALDLRTEAALYEALKRDYPGLTKIIVAQRVASIKDADQIAVLDRGRIVGCGTHESLLQTCPVYRDIVSSQLREEVGA
ncbi:MAG: ABC transporter ATP-binding protein, partial [Oscillospiraceae bacterium]|nr:ABC transporter ATP-binding protein [Oscillospiraceae bacterium]